MKAGCAFALACVLPCAWTPGAFAADDGRWPVANDVVAAAWKQGIDGSGVKVAVLDSQAVEDYPALKHASITYKLGRFHKLHFEVARNHGGGAQSGRVAYYGWGG